MSWDFSNVQVCRGSKKVEKHSVSVTQCVLVWLQDKLQVLGQRAQGAADKVLQLPQNSVLQLELLPSGFDLDDMGDTSKCDVTGAVHQNWLPVLPVCLWAWGADRRSPPQTCLWSKPADPAEATESRWSTTMQHFTLLWIFTSSHRSEALKLWQAQVFHQMFLLSFNLWLPKHLQKHSFLKDLLYSSSP